MVHCQASQNIIEVLLVYQGGLQALLVSIKDQDPDRVSLGLASSLDTVAELELLQVNGTHQCYILLLLLLIMYDSNVLL